MKTVLIIAVIILSTGYAFSQSSDDPRDSLPPPMCVNDVIDLVKSGVSDTIILDQMHASQAYFNLNTDDILQLKQNGVSEYVIDAMIASRYQESQDSHHYVHPNYAPYGWYPSFAFGYWGHYSNHGPIHGPRFVRALRHFGHYGGVHFGGGIRFGGGRRAVGGHR